MKNLIYVLFASVLMLSATSCITLQPPEDPARRAAIEKQFEGKKDSYRSKGTFKKPAVWKVGQYTVTGLTENGVRKSIHRTAIVGKEDGGYILEMINEDARQKVGQQILVKGLEELAAGKENANFQIVWMRMLGPDGKVQKIEGGMVDLMSATMQGSLKKMFDLQAENETRKGGTVTVPAGTFKKTTEIDSVVAVMGMTFRSKVHLHPEVPINGMVRSETSNGKSLTELIEFGKTGAKASF